MLEAGAAQGHALIEGHVHADLGGLADDHAGGVVDEQAGPQGGCGVDIHPGERLGHSGGHPGGEGVPAPPKRVADAVGPDGVHARVAQSDLEGRACGRVAVACRLEVAAQCGQHRRSAPAGQSLRPANRAVERYRSPKEGMTTTISLPAFSGPAATWRAAQMAAPEEMPTSRPSSSAARRARSKASSFSTVMILSMISVSRMAGTKPAPMPWMGCGPFCPPDSTGEAAGSTAMTCTEGLRSFSTSPTPVMVPPVPTPATKMSTSPSVSSQTSSAVVARWTAGLKNSSLATTWESRPSVSR